MAATGAASATTGALTAGTAAAGLQAANMTAAANTQDLIAEKYNLLITFSPLSKTNSKTIRRPNYNMIYKIK